MSYDEDIARRREWVRRHQLLAAVGLNLLLFGALSLAILVQAVVSGHTKRMLLAVAVAYPAAVMFGTVIAVRGFKQEFEER